MSHNIPKTFSPAGGGETGAKNHSRHAGISWRSLNHKLRASAPSLSPWQLLDQFARIQMVEGWFKLRAGGCICLERITQPEAAQAALIHQLVWLLPQQPPPKIYKTDPKNVWTT
jgi:hypothetical protein